MFSTALRSLSRSTSSKRSAASRSIGSVTLEVGEVSGIIPMYLTDCWQWAIKKRIPALQEAELKIETLEAVTYCENCGQTYPTMKYAKICPHCKSDRTYLLTGNEYNIKEIEAY